MNKEISIKNDTITLFFSSIMVIIIIFLTKYLTNVVGLSGLIRSAFSIFEIIVLIVLLYFTFYTFKKQEKDKVKKRIIITLCTMALFIILNFTSIYVVNRVITQKYSKVTDRILSYCNEFECNKYETIKDEKHLDFKITNEYEDYNNKKNYYEIHNICTTEKVEKIRIIVYSDKDSYSEDLIVRLVSDYLRFYDVQVSSQNIEEAFNNRLSNIETIKENVTYHVSEVYNKKKKEKIMIGLKTTIEVKLVK